MNDSPTNGSPSYKSSKPKGYVPKRSVFDEDKANDEEIFVSQYANRNSDGSYDIRAEKIFDRQKEILGKITDEYSESIKQIDNFLETRIPKRRMKTTNVQTDIQEIALRLGNVKPDGNLSQKHCDLHYFDKRHHY